jgi:hypothetical protein
VANGHGAASGEGETFPFRKAMQCARNENCVKLKLEKNLKILQAIRMADVKAITNCRTLTLQAKDFVELLLVVFFFCKT